MAENDTLLANILPRFTGRIEDAAVEALGYILNKSAASMTALNSLVQAGNAEMAAVERVRTQSTKVSSKGQETRLDLVGVDKNYAERVLIEAKFWAGLTDNQPNEYLDRLTQEGPAVLLFVAPNARIQTLWDTLRRRVGEQLGPDDGTDPVYTVPNCLVPKSV